MKTGRNDLCPCDSGRKYKRCCAQQVQGGTARGVVLPSTDISRLSALAAARRYPEMEVVAAKLSRSSPQSGIAWKALGVAQMAQDRDALPALQRAAQLLPNDPECLSNLGAALRRVGRLDEALICYQRALESQPQSAEVWNNHGNLLRDLGRHDEALAAFHRALELKPDLAKSHNNMAGALQDLGLSDEAIGHYRRALELDPLYADAHFNLGTALRLQSRTIDAESSCRRALELDANHAGALILRAEMYSDKGQFDEATACYQRAAIVDCNSPEACAGLAGLRRMSAGDAEWLNEAQRIVGLGLAPRRELHLRYALGKYFDDVGDYASAFSHYQRANELAKIGRPAHDRVKVSAGIDRLMRAHDAPWIARAHPGANQSERPVFIVGMPRSGTTLVEQILATQDTVFGAGELPFWNEAASRYAAACAAGEDESGLLSTLAEEYLSVLYALSGDAQRVVDKMPGNFLYLGMLHAALPRARIIHLERNPLDTCLSIYFQNFSAAHSYAKDLQDLAHYYGEYQRIMQHWRSILPPGVMLEVKYEELVQDPANSSRRILEFIGVPWDESCLQIERSTRAVSTFSKWQVRQSINKISIGRWRHYQPFIAALVSCTTSATMRRAKALHKTSQLHQAEAAYREVLEAEPSNFEALHNLGILALQTGQADLAITHLTRALALNPTHAHANANLGTAYLFVNRLEDALQVYDRALELDSGLAGGWRNRGTILQRLGRQGQAAESFERCWRLSPDFDFALGSMFEARRYMCDWRDYQQNVEANLAGIAAGRNVDRPFSFLSVSASAENQLHCARRHAAYLCPQARPAAWRGERYDHPKIRLAYVSADYRSHVLMQLFMPILEAHARERFHIIGVSLVADDDSQLLQRAKRAVSQFINVAALNDAEAANVIRSLEVDIVVDLTGYTAGCRLGIFAHRPAPVQVGYLGYAGTSGTDFIDYLVADNVTVPESHERFFTERIVRLPLGYMPMGGAELIGAPTPGRRGCGLPDEAFVFCAFGNAYKFSPAIFEIWMMLLQQNPHAVLWLRDGEAGMRINLQREAAAREVDPNRLHFAPKVPAMNEHLARHRQADLFLDTFPFGGHSTVRDALLSGLPVLTCRGESFASRVAASMLTALELPELVTDNLRDYARRAANLAGNTGLLASLRSRLALNLQNEARFGVRPYCARLEAAYENMCLRARRGTAPA